MDAMTPWLLLIIAALIVGCVSLYFQLRQVESQSLSRQSVIADELRDAEGALLSALEKLRQMDTVLAVRERNLASGEASWSGVRLRGTSHVRSLAETEQDPGDRSGPAGREEPMVSVSGSPRAPTSDGGSETERRGDPAWGRGAPRQPAAHAAKRTGPPWRDRAADLARNGMTARQIARKLELPVGEVELALTLASGSGGDSDRNALR